MTTSAIDMRSWMAITLACFGFLLIGCGPDAPDNPSAPTFAQVHQILETNGCATGSCHSGATPQAGLNLEPAVAYDALVGASCENPAAAKAGAVLVAPWDLDASFLFTKITMTHVDPQLGAPMPVIGEGMTAEDVETIREWILSGAFK